MGWNHAAGTSQGSQQEGISALDRLGANLREPLRCLRLDQEIDGFDAAPFFEVQLGRRQGLRRRQLAFEQQPPR